MSKKKSKKAKKRQPPKKSGKKAVIITVCVALAAVLLIVGGVLLDRLTNIKYVDFVGKSFQSEAAYDKKGKEVDLNEIYNVRYDNYHGSLNFKEDSTFSMWMTPGPDDGSHNGTFTYNRGENVIGGEFKNGEKVKFKIVRNKDGTLKRIEAPYEDYTIYFGLQQSSVSSQ